MFGRNSIFAQSNKCAVSIPLVTTKYVSHDDEGNVCIRVLEKDISPLSSLSWDDFDLTRLVKSGINIKALNISTDLRMGFDSEIDAYNNYLMSISDKLYNVESPKSE